MRLMETVTAMRDALRLDSRLHRDISLGNIILIQDEGRDVRRGVLVDWETSCRVDDAGQAMEPGRVVSRRIPDCTQI